MEILAVTGGVIRGSQQLLATEPEVGFQINVFWIITQAALFLLFLGILYLVAFRRIGGVLETRRRTIEQGLKDADQARRDREQAAAERQEVLTQARREANDIVSRAQRVAEDTRERELAAARTELERVREQAEAEIAAERDRALADVRQQVADLAILAASRVVGETMDSPRERRIVDGFLTEVGAQRGQGGAQPQGATS